MNKRQIFYTNHAVKQMFQRNIATVEIENALESGELIAEYPNDKPYPSRLLLSFYNSRPLHTVVSFDEINQKYFIITAYLPGKDQWAEDFKTKKS